MPEFRLNPSAQRDLDDIFDHTVHHWGLTQANRYAEALESAFLILAESPAQAQDCGHIRSGYRRRLVGKHVVYFQITDYGIAIVRILHDRMDASARLAEKPRPNH